MNYPEYYSLLYILVGGAVFFCIKILADMRADNGTIFIRYNENAVTSKHGYRGVLGVTPGLKLYAEAAKVFVYEEAVKSGAFSTSKSADSILGQNRILLQNSLFQKGVILDAFRPGTITPTLLTLTSKQKNKVLQSACTFGRLNGLLLISLHEGAIRWQNA